MPDIPTSAFLAVRDHFFDTKGNPRRFSLRPKRNTQDDPFDEYLANEVLSDLPGVTCVKAPGPLITPDIVLLRKDDADSADEAALTDDTSLIIGLEVKKLERTAQGAVARASGLDYNTTPPCGHMRVYDRSDRPIQIRGFYLFVCVEEDASGERHTSAVAFVDGDLINADYDFYLSIVGERKKRIGLGTYGDGADRARPMLIFSNPLGIPQLDHAATLVHPDRSLQSDRLRQVHVISRAAMNGDVREFFAYRDTADVSGHGASTLSDPFRVPKRDQRTRPRGRFRLPIEIG